MGATVAYDDIPAGFQLGGTASNTVSPPPQQNFSDLPPGFSVAGGTGQQIKQTPDLFDTVSDQALQGATFGLGNRAESGLAALMLSAMNGKSIPQNYQDARNVETQRLQQQMQAHPVASIASNLAGGLATGGLAADTAGGTGIADWLRNGSTAARIAKGGLAGALSGAAYGAGTAPYDQSLAGAEKGALSGALVGGAIPGVGAALSDVGNTAANAAKGIFARSPEALQDTASNLKNAAGNLYTQMRQNGATFNPQATQNLVSDIDSSLASQKFIPALNPKTLAIVDDLKSAAQNGTLGLDDLDQYRRLLGRIAPTEDGVSAGGVRKAIDNFVNNAGANDLSSGTPDAMTLLNQGRKQYAQASKFEDVTDILTKAAGDPNKIKAGLTRFLNNADNTKGWSHAEINALQDAASSTGTEKLLKMGGKFGIDLGTSLTPGNTVAPLIGGAIGGVAAPVAGTASRIGQKLAARGGAENLLQTIANGGQNAAANPTAISPLLSAPAGALAGMLKPASGINAPLSAGTPLVTPTTPLSNNLPQNPPQPSSSLIQRIAQAESGNRNVQNPNSTASGPLQFTDGTWAEMVAKHGKETGIGLKDKNNPQAQAVMGDLLAQDNTKYLASKFGRQPTDGEIYAAHFLGPADAVKLVNAVQANPQRQAVTLFPRRVVGGNRSVFFDGNRPRSVSEVYQLLSNKVSV